MAALSAPLKCLNDLLSTKQGRKAAGRAAALRSLCAALREALEPLGLADVSGPQSELELLRAAALVRAGLSAEQLAQRLSARAAARAAGDWAASDAVREELAARGVALMDGQEGGAGWRPVPPTG